MVDAPTRTRYVICLRTTPPLYAGANRKWVMDIRHAETFEFETMALARAVLFHDLELDRFDVEAI